jgi:hypothetical protein
VILRYLSDFTGSSLISGAVDLANCTRCSADDVEGYLAAIVAQLDIDDDDEVAALTDGLLIERYLFGFSGEALINDLVGDGCMRCTALAIEGYLQGLD